MKLDMMSTRQSIIKTPVEDVFHWHARPGALERLIPAWNPLEGIKNETIT